MPRRRGEKKTPVLSRRILFGSAGAVLLVDQLTKVLAENLLIPGVSVPVLPSWFHLTLVENRGIAFGLFQGADKILTALIAVSIIFLLIIGLRERSASIRFRWGVGLILGGAIGNFADRIRAGAVIDFLDFRVWPVFNFADTAITLGAGLFLLEFFIQRKHAS